MSFQPKSLELPDTRTFDSGVGFSCWTFFGDSSVSVVTVSSNVVSGCSTLATGAACRRVPWIRVLTTWGRAAAARRPRARGTFFRATPRPELVAVGSSASYLHKNQANFHWEFLPLSSVRHRLAPALLLGPFPCSPRLVFRRWPSMEILNWISTFESLRKHSCLTICLLGIHLFFDFSRLHCVCCGRRWFTGPIFLLKWTNNISEFDLIAEIQCVANIGLNRNLENSSKSIKEFDGFDCFTLLWNVLLLLSRSVRKHWPLVKLIFACCVERD